MLEKLEQLDREAFLYLNDMHSPFWDTVMIFMSEKLVWIPFYLALIGYLVWRYRRQSIPMLLLVVIAIGLSDFIASGIMKPYFMRLRPCHDASLSEFINIVEGCGGRFGFISSHAANTFALAVFFNLILSDRYFIFKVILIVWAVVVTYSRIYLGVHFPGDVLLGALLGSCMAYICALAYPVLVNKYPYFRR
ncbi:phosphatase PAP2 family protein [Pontibacter akesuensis]|uniref:Undecaprenyl-diphosphatase n=1 Tax=Pontibacter akesuensis TaxID=388950 RepID=A0A1I7G360_9BACT|nr:phosphatase PAP2 family protein [Pontibacter akesuensis]GHA59164.1 lipid A 4'-phosphatase [Pontibacter akesuensis]SFU42706.1 undecaprenyl-diphosphatase [Pontibacter akesuensis]